MKGHCKICGRPNENNPGDYYHQKDCEAKYWSAQVQKLKEQLKDAERQLEMARYVGD